MKSLQCPRTGVIAQRVGVHALHAGVTGYPRSDPQDQVRASQGSLDPWLPPHQKLVAYFHMDTKALQIHSTDGILIKKPDMLPLWPPDMKFVLDKAMTVLTVIFLHYSTTQNIGTKVKFLSLWKWRIYIQLKSQIVNNPIISISEPPEKKKEKHIYKAYYACFLVSKRIWEPVFPSQNNSMVSRTFALEMADLGIQSLASPTGRGFLSILV